MLEGAVGNAAHRGTFNSQSRWIPSLAWPRPLRIGNSSARDRVILLDARFATRRLEGQGRQDWAANRKFWPVDQQDDEGMHP